MYRVRCYSKPIEVTAEELAEGEAWGRMFAAWCELRRRVALRRFQEGM